MVILRSHKIAFLLFLFLFALSGLYAEEKHRIILDTSIYGIRMGQKSWTLFSTGKGELDIQSQGSRNVKARLAISAIMGQEIQEETAQGTSQLTGTSLEIFSLHYAFIKVRLPFLESSTIRLSMGKNALTWGTGTLFNAGNTAFSATSEASNLLAVEDTVREDTAWYTSIYFPLGKYSFLEPIFIVPLQGITSIGEIASVFPSSRDTTPGARIQGKLGGIMVECSYLYRGSEQEHVPSLNLQGNIGPDVYISASTRIAQESTDILKDAGDNTTITAGLFFLNPFQIVKTCSLRLEALILPRESWEEKPSTLQDPITYGVTLYPELIFAPTDRLTLILRSLISPIDLSTLAILGADYNLYQGFHLYSFLSAQTGEKQDVYSFYHPGGFGITSGFRYTF